MSEVNTPVVRQKYNHIKSDENCCSSGRSSGTPATTIKYCKKRIKNNYVSKWAARKARRRYRIQNKITWN